MKTRSYSRVFAIFAIILSLVLAQWACTTSTGAPTARGSKQGTVPIQRDGTVPGPAPTQPPAKVASPTPQPEPISVTAQGFGQDDQEIGYAFLVNNPNSAFAFENSQYQIAFYNTEGAVVKTESGYISLLLPNQTLGVGGVLYLDENIHAGKMEVQLNAGQATLTDFQLPFTAENVVYMPDEYFSKASGIISNPYDIDLTDLRLSAVVYNETGEIIGGGYTYVNFLLAQGSTGAQVTVTSKGKVGKVEFYPAISGLSMLSPGQNRPSDALKLNLLRQGYGLDESQLGYGMVLENPNSGYAVEYSMYHIKLLRGGWFAAQDGRRLYRSDPAGADPRRWGKYLPGRGYPRGAGGFPGPGGTV